MDFAASDVLHRSTQHSHTSFFFSSLRRLRCTLSSLAAVPQHHFTHAAPPSVISTRVLPFRYQSATLLSLSKELRAPHGGRTSHFGVLRLSRVLLARRPAHLNATRLRRKSTATRQLASRNRSAEFEDHLHLHLSRSAFEEGAPTLSSRIDEARNTLKSNASPSPKFRMKPSFYAVALGRQRGIYSTWDQCSEQVSGYSGATYKSFRTLAEARAFLDEHPVRHTPQNCDVGDAPVAGTALSLPRVKPVRCRDDGVEAAEAPAAASLSPAKRARAGAEEVFGAREGQRPLSSSHPQAVYVDGACSRNGTPNARAGYGGYFGSSDDARNFALPVPITEAQTNNRGELRAVIHGIVQGFVDAGIPKEALATSHCVTPDWRASELARPLQRLVIHTDSRYVIDGLTRYSSKWVENGFKLTSKEPVLNQDLWKQLIRLRDAYNTCYAQQQHEMRSRHPYESMAKSSVSPPKRFHTHNTHNDETEGIELRYVKGHSNNHGNEMADMLAVRGSRMHGETCMK